MLTYVEYQHSNTKDSQVLKMTQKLFVRFSTSKDEKDIFDFYKKNEHAFVFQREAKVWQERIASGAVTIIHDDSGKIVAASISYPLTQKSAKGDEAHQWTEIGSTRVSLEGIGLFNTLVSAQVLRAYLLEPPRDRFVMEIIVGNEHSRHVFSKLGATPYKIPESLAEKVKSTIAPGSGQAPVEWFQIGAEAMPAIARKFVEAMKNNVVVNKKTGEEYELDFSRCVLVTRFQNEVKGLTQQNFGDAEKPDYRRPLKFSP
jgi:hypothetical protein